MKTKQSCRLTKQELADKLADALNLLNDLQCQSDWTTRQTNDYYNLISFLRRNDEVHDHFANNGTLDSRNLT